jgi:hypothetical protein
MNNQLNTRLHRTIALMNALPESITHDIDVDLKSVNTLDFPKKKKKLIKILKDENTPYIVQFKIANFFCNKLANMYHIPIDLSELLVNSVYGVVYRAIELPLTTRLRYLRFQNEKIPFKTSIKLFEGNVRNV